MSGQVRTRQGSRNEGVSGSSPLIGFTKSPVYCRVFVTVQVPEQDLGSVTRRPVVWTGRRQRRSITSTRQPSTANFDSSSYDMHRRRRTPVSSCMTHTHVAPKTKELDLSRHERSNWMSSTHSGRGVRGVGVRAVRPVSTDVVQQRVEPACFGQVFRLVNRRGEGCCTEGRVPVNGACARASSRWRCA